MPKGKHSPVLLAKQLDNRRASERHQRRKALKLERLKAKLEAKGYKFPEDKE